VQVALNLLLPLAISVLRAMGAAMTPYSKYLALRIAAFRIENEIYTYRTKTGKYNTRRAKKKPPSGQSNDASNNNNTNNPDAKVDEVRPSKVLGVAMDHIWADLLSSDITKGALTPPSIFSDPLDTTNVIIQSNIRLQRQFTDMLKPPGKNILTESANVVESLGGGMLGLKKKGAKKAPTTQGPATRKMFNIRVGGAANAAVAATTDVTASPGVNDKGYDLEAGDSKAMDGDAEPPVDGDGDDHEVDEEKKKQKAEGKAKGGFKPMYDNGLEMISADDYMKIRLIPYLALFMSETPSLSRLSQVVKGIVILLSVFSSILSTMDLIGTCDTACGCILLCDFPFLTITVLALSLITTQRSSRRSWRSAVRRPRGWRTCKQT